MPGSSPGMTWIGWREQCVTAEILTALRRRPRGEAGAVPLLRLPYFCSRAIRLEVSQRLPPIPWMSE
jgi:hypothetical protein